MDTVNIMGCRFGDTIRFKWKEKPILFLGPNQASTTTNLASSEFRVHSQIYRWYAASIESHIKVQTRDSKRERNPLRRQGNYP